MVFCGRASLGCTSCRKRRIKCDKVRPECSQCLRVSKTCPGYRDQLSLMFRDETDKVQQKVEAAQSHGDISPTAIKASNSLQTQANMSRRRVYRTQIPADDWSPQTQLSSPTRTSVSPTPGSIGAAFYFEHYLVGYPDEPSSPIDVSGQLWLQHPSSQAIVAALGLVSLANLRGGDAALIRQSREKYGEGLRSIGAALGNPGKYRAAGIRAALLLAFYETVVTSHTEHYRVAQHLMGAMTIIRDTAPVAAKTSLPDIKNILQLCIALISPSIHKGIDLPAHIIGLLQSAKVWCPEEDRHTLRGVNLMARHVRLNRTICTTLPTTNLAAVALIIQQLSTLEEDFAEWEATLEESWLYVTRKDESLPPAAIFRQQYHVYIDCWTARIWAHYWWSRLSVCQKLLELVDEYFPHTTLTTTSTSTSTTATATSIPAILAQNRRTELNATIQQIAINLLTSCPAHYKDPRLTRAQREMMQAQGSAGMGAGGVPGLIFHLQAACCAPNVPEEVSSWGLALLDTIWLELGMMHARTLADVVRSQLAKEAMRKKNQSSTASPEEYVLGQHTLTIDSPRLVEPTQ